MEMKELAMEWRVWVFFAGLLVATVMLNPSYVQGEDGDVQLETDIEDRLGIEFTGGTRLLLKMETNATGEEQQELADQVRDVLSIRMTQLGLPDPQVRTVDIGGGNYRLQVEVGVTNQSQIREVISQEGRFEARMPIQVEDEREFTIEETYNFVWDEKNGSVEVGDETYRPDERFTLSEEGPEFVYINNTERYANIEVVTYTGADVQDVGSGQISGSGPYNWQFPTTITSDAARNVNRIAQNYRTSVNTDEGYLQHDNGEFARMGLYVDGERNSALRMSGVFKDQVLTQSQISGGDDTYDEAQSSLENMQAILQSGSLPVSVEVESTTTLSSALGDDFLRASILSIVGSLIATGLLVTARYQNPKVAIPMVVTGASEVYILLGVWFTTAGTLSLSAIAGIIAAVGTGVDDQIIITDESDREVIQSWTEKMKRAFFVIFTSAASTIGAMSPIIYPGTVSLFLALAGVGLLMYNFYGRKSNRHFTAIGVFAALIGGFIFTAGPSGAAMSSIHDFAWTTILGIMVGITITRPAFSKFMEQLDN
ncbi:MAG: hypothetical protein R6V35_00075 [Candidatus Nanohaloarchaea archaeon]